MVTVGSSRYTYEVIENWGALPEGWTIGEVATVAVDSQDRLYTHQRKEPPILVFDREGNFLNSWGNGAVVTAHGIFIGPDDIVYLTDVGDHVTMKYTLDGKPLLVLGNRGQPSDTGCEEPGGKVLRPGGPFNMPAQMVLSPSGDLYVSDGYRNCRIHRFTPQGQLIASWGDSGKIAPGEFHCPHCMWVDKEGTVFVCDRDNSRIQVFSATGEFITMWTEGLYRPTSIYMDAEETVYLTELSPEGDRAPRGGKVSVWDKKGNNLARCDAPSSHWVYGDSRGDLYAVSVDPSGRLGAHFGGSKTGFAFGINKYVRK